MQIGEKTKAASGSSRRPAESRASGSGPRAWLATMAAWPLTTKLHWILRMGILWEFVGHGGFGLIQKRGWLAYFNSFGISDSAALKIMPIIGLIDITIGVVTFFRPMRAVLVYATFWATMTAVLRPIAGQGIWEEVFERGGNFGIPLALLVLVGLGDRTWKGWFESARPRELGLGLMRAMSWVLRICVAMLLIGHGAFGLSHLHDQEWTSYLGVLGIGPEAILSSHLITLIGWFEIALGVAILLKPFRGLVLFVLVWKLGTEFLRVLAGEPIGEFVERGGNWFLPLALFFVQGWLVQHRSDRVPAAARPPSPVLARLTGAGPFASRGVRVGTAGAACLALTAGLVVFRGDPTVIETRNVALRAEPNAGKWPTLLLSSASEIEVARPPSPGSAKAKADRDEVKLQSIQRSPDVQQIVKKWNGPVLTQPWTDIAFDFVSRSAKNPPLSSRNYGLLHAATYDAVVASWKWKYHYNVQPPSGVSRLVEVGSDPSYPSEHAAIAGAASRLLAYLYPDQSALRLDGMAEEAAFSRVQAGTNRPSDVAAGLELGRRVADAAIARAQGDGADKEWDGTRPPGIGRGPAFWEPPPGAVSPPVAPLAGTWKTWIMTSGAEFRPGPPPTYGSPDFVAAAQEIVDIRRNLTPEQEQIARFYEGAEGTKLPAGIIVDVGVKDVIQAATSDVASKRLTVPQIVRALAMLNMALADAGIATWDAKFAYWNPRPISAVRDLGLDPNWRPLLDTPRFPAYPSGSAGYAGAAQAVLTYLFPDKAKDFAQRAEDQAASRLYAGIHWRYDAIGLEMGRNIGDRVVAWSKGDGATNR